MINLDKPVRKIGIRSNSIAGYYYSRKMKKHVQFESTLERDYYVLLDFDDLTTRYLEQPLELEFEHDNKIRKYTPDIYVEGYDENGNIVKKIIEIKHTDLLTKNKDELKIKLAAIESYALSKGWKFELITESFRNNYFRNAKFLLRYKFTLFNADETDLIEHWMKKLKETTPTELLNYSVKSKQNKQRILSALWGQIARGHIYTDLDKPLTSSSKIILNDFIWESGK